MNKPPETAAVEPTYFDIYWASRFNASSFRRRLNSLRFNYSKFLPEAAARVLEIGPGFGEMLQLLRDQGLTNVEAIDNDFHLTAALEARGYSGVHTIADTIGYCQNKPAEYDCVIALHVLEHFDPATGSQLLEAIYRCLAPGGRVILEVPNMANFITAPYARWADLTHRNGFTQESLCASLKAVGFARCESFGIARAVRSFGEAAAWCGQVLTSTLAWILLKANYPQARIISAPSLAVIGWKTDAT